MTHQNKPQTLVSKILVKPEVQQFMYKLSEERPEAFEHSLNVAYLASEICHMAHKSEAKFEIKDDEVTDIVEGALLHDIGKLLIPNEILNKPDRLNQKERAIIEKHPKLGYELVKDIPEISDLSKQIILHHHEKPDGAGYPDGLKWVPMPVQLVAFCDMYDALTENRSYRERRSIFTTYKILDNENLDKDLFLLLASLNDR